MRKGRDAERHSDLRVGESVIDRREQIDVHFHRAGTRRFGCVGNQRAEAFAECGTPFDHLRVSVFSTSDF